MSSINLYNRAHSHIRCLILMKKIVNDVCPLQRLFCLKRVTRCHVQSENTETKYTITNPSQMMTLEYRTQHIYTLGRGLVSLDRINLNNLKSCLNYLNSALTFSYTFTI